MNNPTPASAQTPAELRAAPGAHYSAGRRWSHISKAWIFAEDWNDCEEVARLNEQVAALQREVAELREALRNLLVMLPSADNVGADADRIPAGFCFVRWQDIREGHAALSRSAP